MRRGTSPHSRQPLAAGARLAAEAEVMGATLLGKPDSSSRQEARRTQCPARRSAARSAHAQRPLPLTSEGGQGDGLLNDL